MTTIAFQDGVLAADSLVTEYGSRLGHIDKIVKKNGILAAACGVSPLCTRFLDWFMAGMAGDPPPMQQGESMCDGVIFYAPDRFVTFDTTGANRIKARRHTMGSGAKFAHGALLADKTPTEAIEIAKLLDIQTGGVVTTLSLDA